VATNKYVGTHTPGSSSGSGELLAGIAGGSQHFSRMCERAEERISHRHQPAHCRRDPFSHQLSKFTASIHLRLQKQITRVAESYLIMGAAVQSNIVPALLITWPNSNRTLAVCRAFSAPQLSDRTAARGVCGLGGANKCDKLTAPRRKSQAIKLIEKYGSVRRIFIIFIAAQISIIP
jgi:hypothetical protein